MNRATHEMLSRLERAGISQNDALALRRISMTLHRWYELECGIDSGRIERDEATEKPIWRSAHINQSWPMPDREKGARKRLDAIMAQYPGKQAYIQGDPRGASLYILDTADVPKGANIGSCYSRGIAVYA